MARVGVIGAGPWGQHLVRAFAELGALAIVAERDEGVRRTVERSFPTVPFVPDHRAVLESGVEAVVIATPVATHAELAQQALVAGKDVFIEKPMALSTAEAEAVQALAVAQGRIVMVGHLLLHQPAIRWIKQYLDSGQLGQVQALYQVRAKLGRVRTVENALWSLGVHDVAVLLHLAGEAPCDVTASGQQILQPGVEDDVFLHLRFPRGIQAHLRSSWLWPVQERRLTVIGTEGMLVYDELEQTVRLHRIGVREDWSTYDHGADVMYRGEAEVLPLECAAFLHSVATRQQPVADGQNGVEVVRVLERAMESLRVREGRT